MIQVVTLPFHTNYGGLVQGYALQRAVASVQAEESRLKVFTLLNYRVQSMAGLRWQMLRSVLWRLLALRFREAENAWRTWRETERVLLRFYRQMGDAACFDELCSKPTPAGTRYVVGSDQVWRKLYATFNNPKKLPFYFLDFAPEADRAHSIAYAASFGSEHWEGNPAETERCAALLRQFKAVSVRELAAVAMCRELFGVEAVQMPDPTLLLNPSDYDALISAERAQTPRSPYIAAYLLDADAEKMASLRQIAAAEGLPVRQLKPLPGEYGECGESPAAPLSVAQWLRHLREASCVVTDSFHGCVFAILFNKPFVCYGNEGRGTARFDTLLQTFGLQSRLVLHPAEAGEALRRPMDWDAVNAIRLQEQRRGLEFLRQNLDSPQQA